MANYIHVPDEAPAVPKIDVTVDESDYRSGALKLIKELRPSWKPSEVKVKVQFISLFIHLIWRVSIRRVSNRGVSQHRVFPLPHVRFFFYSSSK